MQTVCILAIPCCAGCHRFSSNRVITVIPRQASESMWVNEHVGVNEEAARQHVDIYWNGPSEEGDVGPQVVLTDKAIRHHDLGIILSPSNPFALNTSVQHALAAGVSVVIVGNPLTLKPGRKLSFILNDEIETGVLAAHRIQSALKGHGEVLIIGINPLPWGGPDRTSAFEAELSSIAPGIHVVDRLKGSFSFGQAELAVENAILAHPHLSAIVSLSITATRGAIAATRTTHSSNHIIIVGCDQNIDLLFLLRQGVIDSLVAENTRAMGAMAVDSIIAENRGSPVAPYTFVKPVLITKENIDDEAIQRIVYLDWRVQP